jgi:hypothetical protein
LSLAPSGRILVHLFLAYRIDYHKFPSQKVLQLERVYAFDAWPRAFSFITHRKLVDHSSSKNRPFLQMEHPILSRPSRAQDSLSVMWTNRPGAFYTSSPEFFPQLLQVRTFAARAGMPCDNLRNKNKERCSSSAPCRPERSLRLPLSYRQDQLPSVTSSEQAIVLVEPFPLRTIFARRDLCFAGVVEFAMIILLSFSSLVDAS